MYYSSDYRNGYERALSDVKKYLEEHKNKLTSAKFNNIDGTIKVVQAMLRYKVEMREAGTVPLAVINCKKIKHVKDITEEELAKDNEVKVFNEESKKKIRTRRKTLPPVIRYM